MESKKKKPQSLNAEKKSGLWLAEVGGRGEEILQSNTLSLSYTPKGEDKLKEGGQKVQISSD